MSFMVYYDIHIIYCTSLVLKFNIPSNERWGVNPGDKGIKSSEVWDRTIAAHMQVSAAPCWCFILNSSVLLNKNYWIKWYNIHINTFISPWSSTLSHVLSLSSLHVLQHLFLNPQSPVLELNRYRKSDSVLNNVLFNNKCHLEGVLLFLLFFLMKSARYWFTFISAPELATQSITEILFSGTHH